MRTNLQAKNIYHHICIYKYSSIVNSDVLSVKMFDKFFNLITCISINMSNFDPRRRYLQKYFQKRFENPILVF